jgi:hypothetical protein
MQSDSAEIKPAQCCIKLVFHLTYTMMHGNTKLKFHALSVQCVNMCRRRDPPVGMIPFVFLYNSMCITITKSIHKIYVTIFCVGRSLSHVMTLHS